MISELPSKSGSRITVQHGSSPLSLKQTLRQRGIVGEGVTLSYVYVRGYLAGAQVDDDEFSLHGLTRIGGIEWARQLEGLPSSLQQLELGDRFNDWLQQTSFPSSIKTMTLGYDFNRSLDGVTLPADLQTLTFGYRFNRSLDGVTFPASLQTLIFGSGFNQSLDGVTFPAGLQTLTLRCFDRRFNQSLHGLLFLPTGLQERSSDGWLSLNSSI